MVNEDIIFQMTLFLADIDVDSEGTKLNFGFVKLFLPIENEKVLRKSFYSPIWLLLN